MFDDLRSKGSVFEDDQEQQELKGEKTAADTPTLASIAPPKYGRPSSTEIRILGMTAAQRLVIAIMVFLNVSVLGFFLLVASRAVVFPYPPAP